MTQQELNVPEKQEARDEVTRAGRTYVPQVDIFETKDGLWLWADMPGVDEESLNVHLDDGVLSIEGQVDVKQYEEMNPLYTEYNVGNYVRRFTLSSDVDSDRIVARMQHGVLSLEIPKAERTKPRRIAITR
ncbi:MAG: Hsp20/alpha crystallin family protein [Deltaproteobacteria bacterium]|nr:Hsp20/alpha crystallin family protein [Deltaproteobacteria bacterium]